MNANIKAADFSNNFNEVLFSNYICGRYVDARINTSNGSLKVHKKVLNENDVLKKMVTLAEQKNKEKTVINLPQFSLEVMIVIVEYLYRGRACYFMEIEQDVKTAINFFEPPSTDIDQSCWEVKREISIISISDSDIDELPRNALRRVRYFDKCSEVDIKNEIVQSKCISQSSHEEPSKLNTSEISNKGEEHQAGPSNLDDLTQFDEPDTGKKGDKSLTQSLTFVSFDKSQNQVSEIPIRSDLPSQKLCFSSDEPDPQVEIQKKSDNKRSRDKNEADPVPRKQAYLNPFAIETTPNSPESSPDFCSIVPVTSTQITPRRMKPSSSLASTSTHKDKRKTLSRKLNSLIKNRFIFDSTDEEDEKEDLLVKKRDRILVHNTPMQTQKKKKKPTRSIKSPEKTKTRKTENFEKDLLNKPIKEILKYCVICWTTFRKRRHIKEKHSHAAKTLYECLDCGHYFFALFFVNEHKNYCNHIKCKCHKCSTK